ncbi:replication protein [Enterococcus gilvus]|uniref:replication protein n=1 Tax=Enterococcus gilvus TaxID=160453 RepID=UPI001C8BD338|nr:replication protein [Enterococcus gilvus]MBX8939599.1 replication protein RepB [Enterococcus gilvus]
MNARTTKARNFAFIIYPESIPENWVECLSKLGIPMAVSPLHDLDESERKFSEMSEAEKAVINSGNKVYKKAHYHVLYIARNPVTVESVRKKIKRVLGDNSISHIEIVDSVEYYFQYLTHESSDAVKKNKHRYDKKDIVYINDFDIDRYVTLDESEKRELANLIFALIRKYQLENIIDLYEFVEAHGDDYGLPSMNQINDVVSAKAGLLRLYFDGNYQRRKRGVKND